MMEQMINLPNVSGNVQEHIFTAFAFGIGFSLSHHHMHQPPIKSSKIEKYNTQDPIVDEAVLKDQLGLYAEQKGLFLLSFLTFARLSPDGASSHVARVSAIPPETWVPGVVEQYALQLAKLGSGMASLEIVSMPTYFSRPDGAQWESNTPQSWQC